MKYKKILCLIICFVLCLSAAGCGKDKTSSGGDNTEHSVPQGSGNAMQLLYCESDSFNPYAAATAINREVCKLLYDPLYKTDNSFSAVPALALSAENNGNICKVTLRDAAFTDGSPVTASDVVYSCNIAKNTAGAYAASMYEVAAVSAESSKTVVFKLTRRDPYFLNLLTFPIIKENSDKTTNTDGVTLPPTGCGRFKLSDDGESLIPNTSYYGIHPNISSVRLINAPDTESVEHFVEIGATDAYFTDISDGKIVRMSGKKVDINLNNLVYIGINGSSPLLSSAELRYAISSAIDRQAVCKSSYYDNAVAATGFFHPAFGDTSAVQTLQNSANTQIALENLEKIGYNRLDNEGYRINSSGKRLILTLLVNSENASRKAAAELIAAQLKVIGIELRIAEKSFDQYSAALSSGGFELYLGEILFPANMDVSSLVLPGGSAAYGVIDRKAAAAESNGKNGETDEGDTAAENTEPQAAALSDIFAAFYAGTNGIKDIATALLTELPCIPVCFREGLLFYDESVCDLSGASASDIFLSLASDTK